MVDMEALWGQVTDPVSVATSTTECGLYAVVP